MTIERPTPFARIALTLAAVLALAPTGAVSAQSHRPPPEPPAEWGPISINLEGYEYPHPVEFMNFRVFGQDVRIAYMDVAPTGPANGRAVVLHHGGSYYGWYWESQIEALAAAGYRVVVKDRLGWGKSSKPILPYSMSLHASNTARLMEHLGNRRGGHRRALHRGADGDPVRLPLSGEDDASGDRQPDRPDRPACGARVPSVRRRDRRRPGPAGRLRGGRPDRHAALRGVEARIHRPPPDSPRPAAERRLAAARVRAPARRQPALDGHGGQRLAPHPDQDADPRRGSRRARFPRQRAAGGPKSCPTARSFSSPTLATTPTRRCPISSTPS